MCQVSTDLLTRTPAAGCYNARMTLVEITYELQSPLTEEQLRRLGQFANTYGLRSFRLDDSKKQLSFEYDAYGFARRRAPTCWGRRASPWRAKRSEERRVGKEW